MTDEDFDQLLGALAQARSEQFFTPQDVAEYTAQSLCALGARRVLDVGSGVGKFCLLAGRAQPGLTLHGIERRSWLVEEAERVRKQLGLENVSFSCGDAFESSFASYDALYLFNPFSEHLAPPEDHLDQSIELSRERFAADVQRMDFALRLLPPGQLLATYHGIAGAIPSSYDLLKDEPIGTNRLRIWRRAARRDSPWVYLETDQGVFCADRREFARVLLGQESPTDS